MAKNLRQFSYTPGRKTANSNKQANMADLKTELLASLKDDLSTLIRSELKDVLAGEFKAVKSEIQAVKTEIVNSVSRLRTELETVTTKVSDMEHSLTTCSDDVTTLQATVEQLQANVLDLQQKCMDMEGRMRKSNIRILNVPEEAGPGAPSFVTKLLTEVFGLDKEVLVDRSHRVSRAQLPTNAKGKRKADKREADEQKPRPIIAKLHYFQDCVEILRLAKEAGDSLRYEEVAISIFPDYPPSVARARAAFNDVKHLLRGREDVRYGVLYPAKLRITFKGTRKDFLDPRQAMSYVKSNIVVEETPSSSD